MEIKLDRFKVKAGKSQRVDEWLEMLNARMPEVLETLEREQMKFEVIFREIIDGEEYITWIEVQDERGEDVKTSPFPLDHDHLAFVEECVDHDYGMHRAQPQVVMVPPAIAAAMNWPNPAGNRVEFQPVQLIKKRSSP